MNATDTISEQITPVSCGPDGSVRGRKHPRYEEIAPTLSETYNECLLALDAQHTNDTQLPNLTRWVIRKIHDKYTQIFVWVYADAEATQKSLTK